MDNTVQIWELDEYHKEVRESLNEHGWDAYCLFCMTGMEKKLASELNNNYDGIVAMPMTRMVHHSRNGYKYDAQDVILKGYVFLFVPGGADVTAIRPILIPFRFLEGKDESALLSGSDREYAERVLGYGGLITVSKAIRINSRVKIIEGPLLDLEGRILEYSKKNRNCRVRTEFMGNISDVWLPFDWVDDRLD